MLTGREKLAKTSNTPGKTQMINHFKITAKNTVGAEKEEWYLVDLPGFGYAKRSISTRNQWEKMTERYIRERQNLLQLFLLIDCRHPPQKIDLDFALKLYQWEVPYTILFTKADKEKQSVINKNISLFKEELSAFQQFLPRMIVTSSVKKSGRNKVLDLVKELNEEWINNKESI